MRRSFVKIPLGFLFDSALIVLFFDHFMASKMKC